MSLLLASSNGNDRWSKVFTVRARKNGGLSLAAKWHGSVESYVVRAAARFFAAEKAAVEMFYEVAGRKYRITKY